MKAVWIIVPALAAGLRDIQTPAEHAQDAAVAEQLATAVTAHSATLAETARQALEHAHQVLVNTRQHDLPQRVDDRLNAADAALVAATKKAELDQLDQAAWLEAAVAEQGGGSISAEIDTLTTSVSDDLSSSTDAELRAELDALKQRLAAQRAETETRNAEEESASELVAKLKVTVEGIDHQLDVLEQQEGELADSSSSSSDAEPRRKNLQARVETLKKQLEAMPEPPLDDEVDRIADEVEKLQADVAQEVMSEDNSLGGAGSGSDSSETPVAAASGPDVDTDMPFGELKTFGREDTAQELTDKSLEESDRMVDQIEKAQVAEEKRSVYRALTRLRGAAISSFDGIARSQTGNIDEYTHSHQWRTNHPLHHLADEENDVQKWAFPTNADLAQVSAKIRSTKLDTDLKDPFWSGLSQ